MTSNEYREWNRITHVYIMDYWTEVIERDRLDVVQLVTESDDTVCNENKKAA